MTETAVTGPATALTPPRPGERVIIDVGPGMDVALPDAVFDPTDARYTVAGPDLVVTLAGGGVLVLENFFAHPEAPPTLAVVGGPPVDGTTLLQSVQVVAQERLVQVPDADDVQPAAGPASRSVNGGGAGFSPYEPGDLGTGLDPLGPLGPTALAYAVEFDEPEGTPDDDGNGERAAAPPSPPPPPPPSPPENAAPRIEALATTADRLQVVNDPFQLPSAPAFPVIGEGESVPVGDVNGLEQSLLVGSGREISVVFTTEYSVFKNSFGVFEIGADGRLGNVRVLAPEVEHAAADPDFPRVRPGGGPLEAGQSFSLGVVPDGTKFGFFVVSNGFSLNPQGLFDGPGSWELRDARGGTADLNDTGGLTLYRITTATDGSAVATAVRGLVFVSADADASDPNVNLLNSDGKGHVISGLDSSTGTIVFGFDDQASTGPVSPTNDRDFNDVVFAVRYGDKPAEVAFIPEVETAITPQISDSDSALLQGATARLGGFTTSGDTLAIVGFTDANGDGLLDRTNIRLEQVSATELRLSGEDSIARYEAVLGGLRYDNDTNPLPGVRELALTVTDDKDTTSDPFKVAIDIRDLLITGDSGNDLLVGTTDDDGIQGRAGNDRLEGGAGDDLIDGGAGNDRLDGGSGDDMLFGGTGKDAMTGGAGKDSFVINSLVLGTETILDFDRGEGDRIDLGKLMTSGDYKAGVSNDADYFRLAQVDTDGDGSTDDIQLQVDVDGRGKGFTFQAIANLTEPSGVGTDTPIDQVVTGQQGQASDGATV